MTDRGASSAPIVSLIFFKLLGSGCSRGVSDDECATCGEAAGGDLNNLAAVAFADNALENHLLRLVAVLHESGVLLEEVSKLVRAECYATLVRHVEVAESFHAVKESLIGVGLGDSAGCDVAALGSLGSEGGKDVGVVSGDDDFLDFTGESLTGIASILLPYRLFILYFSRFPVRSAYIFTLAFRRWGVEDSWEHYILLSQVQLLRVTVSQTFYSLLYLGISISRNLSAITSISK